MERTVIRWPYKGEPNGEAVNRKREHLMFAPLSPKFETHKDFQVGTHVSPVLGWPYVVVQGLHTDLSTLGPLDKYTVLTHMGV